MEPYVPHLRKLEYNLAKGMTTVVPQQIQCVCLMHIHNEYEQYTHVHSHCLRSDMDMGSEPSQTSAQRQCRR
jgi:hypothetical protein